MAELIKQLGRQDGAGNVSSATAHYAMPSFPAFDPSAELWKDYWARFQTFAKANAVPMERLPQVFLTNQTSVTYKLLSTLSAQQAPAKEVNDLSMDDIAAFMDAQYDPKRFIVRERFRFWSEMQRKPGETVQELAARIRQDDQTRSKIPKMKQCGPASYVLLVMKPSLKPFSRFLTTS